MTFSPIDCKWYLMVIAVSTAFFNAVNSAPKVLVWTHVCLVDFQWIGVDPTNAIIPVTLLLVTRLCA